VLYDFSSNNTESTDLLDLTGNQASMNTGIMRHPVARPVGSGVSASRSRKIQDQSTPGRTSPALAHPNVRNDQSSRSTSPGTLEDSSLGSRGLVWATADRNYR
jgi:hypothetical protein